MTYSIVSLSAAISRPEYRLSYVLIFISHSVSNQFLLLNTFSFSSEFFTYQLQIPVLSLESSHLPSCFRVSFGFSDAVNASYTE